MKRTLLICLIVGLAGLLQAQVNTEPFRQDADTIGLSGNIALSGVLMTGNTDLQLLDLGGRLNQNWGVHYTFLVWSGGIGWNDGKTLLNNGLAHLRNVLRLNAWIQNELFFQYDMDRNRLLRSRLLGGIGLRFKLFTRKGLKIRLGTAYMLEHEAYDLPPGSVHPVNDYGHRLSSYLTCNFDLAQNLNLVSVNYIQPKLDEWSDYKFISENMLVVRLSSLFDFHVTGNVRFDSRPPDGTKRLDTITKFGLSFNFK